MTHSSQVSEFESQSSSSLLTGKYIRRRRSRRPLMKRQDDEWCIYKLKELTCLFCLSERPECPECLLQDVGINHGREGTGRPLESVTRFQVRGTKRVYTEKLLCRYERDEINQLDGDEGLKTSDFLKHSAWKHTLIMSMTSPVNVMLLSETKPEVRRHYMLYCYTWKGFEIEQNI